MKRIICGVLTAGAAAFLLAGSAAHAEEGFAPPAMQQAHWREGDRHEDREREAPYQGGYRSEERREARYRRALELRRREEQRERQERYQRERFEHSRYWRGW